MPTGIWLPDSENDSPLYELPGSGLLVPESIARSRRWPKAVDVFAGCGGASLGFKQAGFHVLAAIEWNPEAVMT